MYKRPVHCFFLSCLLAIAGQANANDLKECEASTQISLQACTRVISSSRSVDEKYKAYIYRGLLQREEKLLLEDFEMAIQLAPSKRDAYAELWIMYMSGDEYDKAVLIATRAIQAVDDYSRAGMYRYRGDAYAGAKDYANAIKDYDKAISLGDNWAEPSRLRALIELGEYELALLAARSEIAKNPNGAFGFVMRGRIYEYQGKHTQAVSDYRRAYEISKQPPNFHMTEALDGLNRLGVKP